MIENKLGECKFWHNYPYGRVITMDGGIYVGFVDSGFGDGIIRIWEPRMFNFFTKEYDPCVSENTGENYRMLALANGTWKSFKIVGKAGEFK